MPYACKADLAKWLAASFERKQQDFKRWWAEAEASEPPPDATIAGLEQKLTLGLVGDSAF